MSEKQDKWKAAVHESGHATASRNLGGFAKPSIFKNPAKKRGESTWIGVCQTTGTEESPANLTVIVGMAGFIAERIEDGITNIDTMLGLMKYAVENNKLSGADKILIGEQWCIKDIEETINLLVENWEHVIFEANWLIQVSD